LKQHIHPENYPLPLAEPIAPYWRVKKLERIELARGISIAHTKPKWIAVEEEKSRLNEGKKKKVDQINPFVFPVPIVENSGKIRKRKVQVYRKINYHLP
jgi:large subunit ribosomal protein L15